MVEFMIGQIGESFEGLAKTAGGCKFIEEMFKMESMKLVSLNKI